MQLTSYDLFIVKNYLYHAMNYLTWVSVQGKYSLFLKRMELE